MGELVIKQTKEEKSKQDDLRQKAKRWDKVKAEYRCEKLLLFYLFDIISKRLNS